MLLLDGKGTTEAGTVTHDGLVALYYDRRAAGYRWNGYEIGRKAVNAEARLIEGGLEWSLPAGGATVRFTIRFDAETWHEEGDVSTDGRTWNRFMEMNLVRELY